MNCKSIALLSLCLALGSCAKLIDNSVCSHENYTFSGNWVGEGEDSKGNPFIFFSKVSHLGDNNYRMLILTDLDAADEPLHIMDGILENNKFSYTSDEGLYKGDGTLSKHRFEGYYKGPIDGTYRMWRINSEIDAK